MSLKAKYQPVLDLGDEFGVKDGYVEEEAGKLKIGGTAKTQYQKNQMWDKIKEIGGDSPEDLAADIRVENIDYYHKHTVQQGESLSLIAKHYFGDPMKYKEIHEANKDTIKDPNVIYPDQEIVIPFVD